MTSTLGNACRLWASGRSVLGTCALILALIPSASSRAQDFSNAVASEVGEREMALLRVNHYLGQGDRFAAEGDLRRAAAAYRAAFYELPFGSRAQGFRETARDKFAETATAYALSLAEKARLKAAQAVLDEVLKSDVAPDYEPAKVLQQRLNDPDWYAPGNTLAHVSAVETVERLLNEAKTLAQLGKYDEATAKYSEVINLDETNGAARNGLLETERLRVEAFQSARDRMRAELLDEIEDKWRYDDPDAMRRAGIGRTFDPVDQASQAETPQSEAIARKLTSIIIPEIRLEGVTLESALNYLQVRSVELDNTGISPLGVKFVLSNDPTIERARLIRIALREVPLAEVLRYVTEQANARYLVEGFAVRVIGLTSDDATMITREFTVRPDFFTAGPASGAADAGADPFGEPDDTNVSFQQVDPEEFLRTHAGVDFPEGAFAQYIPAANLLTVRNTRSNLDLVGDLVAGALQEGPKQVVLTVRHLDISQENLDEIQFDWLLGPFDFPGGEVVGGGGTFVPPDQADQFAFADPVTGEVFGGYRVTGGLRSGQQAVETDAFETVLEGRSRSGMGVERPAPGAFSVAGILTQPEFQAVLRGLDQKKSVDVLIAPTVTVRSGQRAKIESGIEFTYPIEYDPPELPQRVGVVGGFFPVTPAHPTQFEMRPLGFVLEVDPTIGPGNSSIDVNLAPEFAEFIGFVNYGSPITAAGADAVGNPTQIVITENNVLMPVFSTVRASLSATLYDGATLVIAGLREARVDTVFDKVPVIGDLPFVGRLFRSRVERQRSRAVVIFLTAKIIDPSGARVNPDRF